MATKPVLIDKFEDLEIVSFPFRVGNIASIIFFGLIFSYLLGIMRTMGPIGFFYSIMLTYFSFMFFFGYLFVIVDYTSRGYQEVPKLSANLLITVRSRMFKELILISFFFAFFFLFDNAYWNLIVVLTSLLFFPIATSVIIMEESLISALNPLKWIRVLLDIDANAMFMQYLAIQAFTLIAGYVALFVDFGWFNIITMALFLMATLIVFRSLGVVLHSNSESLGFPVRFGKQVEEEQIQLAKEHELSDFSTQLYKLRNAGKLTEAWELLQKRLRDDNFMTEADLFARLREWDNPRLAVKAGQGFIERLTAKQDFRTCWNVLEFCYTANGNDYKLTSAQAVLTLSAKAESRTEKSIMVSIIRHFEEDFPNHPKTAEILLTAARFTAYDLDDFDGARKIINHLHTTYPSVHSNKSYRALHSILMNEVRNR